MSDLSYLLSQVAAYSIDTRNRIVAEVPPLIRSLGSLHCQVAHEDRRPSTLLKLVGTFPISYKGNTYHIPGEIWLLENYPNAPPKCVITPTPDMAIKEGHRNVDPKGVIYLPYLHKWNPYCNLDELLTFMSNIFSDDPPVYRKPEPQSQPLLPPMPVARDMSSPRADAKLKPKPVVQPAVQPSGAQRKDNLVKQVTEKFKQVHTQFNKEFSKELDGLFEKQNKLNANAVLLTDASVCLKKEQDSLTVVLENFDKKIAEAEKWLATNERKQEINLDDAILPQDTWSKQMFEAVANDAAIEDALYALDSALMEERIDLSTFLKQVRKLARIQFFHRALALKISAKQAQLANSKQ